MTHSASGLPHSLAVMGSVTFLCVVLPKVSPDVCLNYKPSVPLTFRNLSNRNEIARILKSVCKDILFVRRVPWWSLET